MMECDKIQSSLVDYIDNNLSENDAGKAARHMKTCKNCESVLKEMQEFLSVIAEDEMEQPSKNLRKSFEQMLAKEKQHSESKVVKLDLKRNWKWYLQIAASILLLFGSFLFGRYQQTKKFDQQLVQLKNENLASKQTTSLALMENKSASKRIKGIQYIEEFSDPDPEIVNALVKRMQNDENSNVRLNAVTSLQRFITSDTVKDGLIKALDIEKDPGIQIIIIQSLVKIQERKLIKPMQRLLDKEDTQPFVKEEIKTILSNII